MKTIVLVVYMTLCCVVFVFCTLAILTSKDLPVLPSWWFSKHFEFHLIKYQYEATAKDPIVAYADLYEMYISGLNGTTEREYDERHHPWMDVLSLSFFGIILRRARQSLKSVCFQDATGRSCHMDHLAKGLRSKIRQFRFPTVL